MVFHRWIHSYDDTVHLPWFDVTVSCCERDADGGLGSA